MSTVVLENKAPSGGLKIAAFICRVVVGGLFIYAALSKIIDPLKFAEEVRAYELAPVILTNAVAIVLPWLELFAGALLIIGFWRAEARLLILLMMFGFTFGKISVEARGMDINCGCWGSDWMESFFHGIWGVLLNLFLIGLLVVDHIDQRFTAALQPVEQQLPVMEKPS